MFVFVNGAPSYIVIPVGYSDNKTYSEAVRIPRMIDCKILRFLGPVPNG